MEKKDSLIFYISHYQAIKILSDEQLGRLFRLIFEKQLGNEVVFDEKNKDIEIAFNFINNQLLIDEKKYKELSEKRSNSGKKGGAPKGNKNAKKTIETSKTNKDKQNKLNDNENDNDNDNDNENDNVVVEDKEETTTDLFQFYENSFGRTISSAEYEIINTWEDTELTRYAIKQAELARAFNIRYIQSILADYQKENIKTVAEAEERERKFQESKTTVKNTYKTTAEKNREVLANAREKIARGEVK